MAPAGCRCPRLASHPRGTLLERGTAEGIVITKHGKPVAKLIPIDAECAELIGALKGKIEIRGDLLSTGLCWDAES